MKLYFETYGCSANLGNSELMQGQAIESGHEVVLSSKDADVVVVNTCTVKTPTQNKILKKIQEYNSLGKKLIVAGCMSDAQSAMIKQVAPSAKLLSSKITDIVGCLEGKSLHETEIKPCRTKKRSNNLVNIVQISEGCLGKCSYCITKLAKGRLVSYAKKDILDDVRQGVNDGCKEIWLTSQDTGVYGFDIGLDLAVLLEDVCNIEGEFKVRVGMMNPFFIKRYLDKLVKVFKQDKMFKFLHLAVQSGSDKVLADMKRGYSAADFVSIIQKFREEIPDITLSTDIICGFPTETEEDFQKSLKLIRAVKPAVLNISRYWSRPGTEAAYMQQLSGGETKNRSKMMTDSFNKIAKEQNTLMVGKVLRVLLDEVGKCNTTIGRTDNYRPVVVKGIHELGAWVNVKITDATNIDLRGELSE